MKDPSHSLNGLFNLKIMHLTQLRILVAINNRWGLLVRPGARSRMVLTLALTNFAAAFIWLTSKAMRGAIRYSAMSPKRVIIV